jgi:cobalamin biosynthesis protein CobD/CbiB
MNLDTCSKGHNLVHRSACCHSCIEADAYTAGFEAAREAAARLCDVQVRDARRLKIGDLAAAYVESIADNIRDLRPETESTKGEERT